jgi:hypothetical protein
MLGRSNYEVRYPSGYRVACVTAVYQTRIISGPRTTRPWAALHPQPDRELADLLQRDGLLHVPQQAVANTARRPEALSWLSDRLNP